MALNETAIGMMLNHYKQFGGAHAEAGALANLLAYEGVTMPHTRLPATDALIFGLGGGIGCGYFVYSSGSFLSLFIATQITTDESFLDPLCARLGLQADITRASSAGSARKQWQAALAGGHPPLVWVNRYEYPYYSSVNSYHAVVVYGIDDQTGEVWFADRSRKPITASAAQFDRFSNNPGTTKFKWLALKRGGEVTGGKLRAAVREGIVSCVAQMQKGFAKANFSPNFGLSALEKWAEVLVNNKRPRGWRKMFPRGEKMVNALFSAHEQIEHRGGGGSAFRNLYADFLIEAADVLRKPALADVATQYRALGKRWGKLADSLLPGAIPEFKEARQLLARKRKLFELKGGAAGDEIAAVDKRLGQIKSKLSKTFPLADEAAGDLRQKLSAQILDLHAEEKATAATLGKLVS